MEKLTLNQMENMAKQFMELVTDHQIFNDGYEDSNATEEQKEESAKDMRATRKEFRSVVRFLRDSSIITEHQYKRVRTVFRHHMHDEYKISKNDELIEEFTEALSLEYKVVHYGFIGNDVYYSNENIWTNAKNFQNQYIGEIEVGELFTLHDDPIEF